MKRALLALFAVLFVTSMCFAEETSAPLNANNSANLIQASINAPASAQISKTSTGTTAFTGKVVFVSSGSGISGAKPQITVQDDKGQVMTFMVPSDATIVGKDGNPTTFHWIGRDDKVNIEYVTAQDGTQTAKSIKISSAW